MTSEGPDPNPTQRTSKPPWQFTYDSSRNPVQKPVLGLFSSFQFPFYSFSNSSFHYHSIYPSLNCKRHHMRTPDQSDRTTLQLGAA